MLKTAEQRAASSRTMGGRRRTALLIAAGCLACALGAGVAVASDASEEATATDGAAAAVAAGDGAEDAAATNPTANVYESHLARGVNFDALVVTDTEGLTPEEIAAGTVGTREFCLSCHNWDDIVDSTILPGDVTVYNKDGMYNVHDNHNGLVNCSDCHSVDKDEPSTLGCVSCHYMELPDGWEGFY